MAIVNFDTNLLVGLFNAKSLQTLASQRAISPSLATSSSGSSRGAAVLPPWDVRTEQPTAERRLKDALSNNPFISLDNPRFNRDDVPLSHQNLFALYAGLSRLNTLAREATDETTVSGQLAGLDRRFQAGLTEITSYLKTLELEDLVILQGEKTDTVESAVGIPRVRSGFDGNVVHKLAYDEAVPGLNGDEVFTVSVTKLGVTTDVQVDLANLGGATLNLDNIADLVNTELENAGFLTRLDRIKIGDNGFGFGIEGVSTETVAFSAAVTTPALYVTGVSGKGDSAGGDVVKLTDLANPAGPATSYADRIEQEDATASPSAIAVDSQGFTYVVGNSNGDFGNQLNQSSGNDVFLTKYDSTGQVVWTRLLGASEDASGFSVAVDGDDNVVVAGQASGDLDSSAIGGGLDSFVTKYDSKGDVQFTRQIAPVSEDGAFAVTTDSTGNILIAGYTKSRISSDQTHGGLADGYLTKLDADGGLVFNRQFGGAGDERAVEVAVASDGNYLVASVEDGHAVLRKFDAADPQGAALWEVDLGDLQGGSIGGLVVDGGQVYLGGTTSNAALDGGTASIASAHSGGKDGFVVRIDDAGASASAAVTSYLGSDAADSINTITVEGGSVYVGGSTEGSLPGNTLAGTSDAFVARLDNAGAVDWVHQYAVRSGTGGVQAITADSDGASVLDVLGLPAGDVAYTDSRRLTSATSVRPGDYFELSIDGGRRQRITIDADDTLTDLVRKVNRKLIVSGRADSSIDSGYDVLEIKARPGVQIELFAGEGGFDALQGLGIEPGLIVNEESGEDDDEAEKGPLIFGLGLKAGINLLDRSSASEALSVISDALSAVRGAYRELTRDPLLDELAKRKNTGGTVPQYLTNQIANFQAGLARLGGSFDSSF